MPRLADLYGIDLNRLGGYSPEYTSVMERPLTDFEREQRAAPIDRPYASGQLEAPMFAPDDLIGSGIPTKLAALAKGSIPAIAGIFIGPKHPAWNKEAAELAMQMKVNKVDPRSIWKTTGTMTELPGVPAMQEISDKDTGLRHAEDVIGEIQHVYRHPELFKGYDKLREGMISVDKDDATFGEYYRTPKGYASIAVSAPSPELRRSVALHELQHGVFGQEGWDPGASLMRVVNQFPSELDVQKKYLNHQGEVMARITEARRDMDDLQRRRHYPLDGISLKDLWSE